jgi:hypothetical protein
LIFKKSVLSKLPDGISEPLVNPFIDRRMWKNSGDPLSSSEERLAYRSKLGSARTSRFEA